MPNWVRNRISIKGENVSDIVMSLMTFDNDGDELEFDFNKIIHRPEELNIEKSSKQQEGIDYLKGKLNLASLKRRHKEDYKEIIELGQMALNNLAKYGATDWYEWSLKNWGCKWNASNTYLSQDRKVIEFETPWAPCIPIIVALSKKYPELEITYEYAEEQIAYYTGMMVIKGGEIIMDICEDEFSKEAYERYFDLWGEDDSYEYDKTIDNYRYIKNNE